jgi:hypothetical protein
VRFRKVTLAAKVLFVNTHEDYRREVAVKSSSNRSFGFWIAAVLVVFALLPLRHRLPIRSWFLAVAILLALIAWVRPQLLHYPNLVWSRFGLLLGRVTQPVIMTLLFFVVFTPAGLIRRLFQKRSLRVFRDASCESYWLPRVPPGPAPDAMRNQF